MHPSGDTPTHHATRAAARPAPRSHLTVFATSVAALLLVVLLSACSGAGASDSDGPTQPADQAAQPTGDDQAATNPAPTDEAACGDGELTIGELTAVDELWRDRRAGLAAQATAWQADAILTDLSLRCWWEEGDQDFVLDVEWTATYYSPSADRSFWVPDGEDPGFTESEHALDPDTISFAKLRDWLIAAGHDESTVIAGAGFDSTPNFCGQPGDRFYYHVALIIEAGDWATFFDVDAETGAVEVDTVLSSGSACEDTGGGTEATTTGEAEAIATAFQSGGDVVVGPCDDDVLTVGELARVDEVWQVKQPEIAAAGAAWQEDAALVQLSAGCYLFDQPEIFYVFHSASTNLSLVGGTEADMGEALASLDPAAVSFTSVQEWLVAAGYAAEAVVESVDFGARYAPQGDDSGEPFVQVELRVVTEQVFVTFDLEGTLVQTEE